MAELRPAHQLLEEYGDEPYVTIRPREAAAQAFAALEAVIELHRETAEQDAARGHWTAPWKENGHWVRDQPAWCPVCDVALPCDTVRVIAEKLS